MPNNLVLSIDGTKNESKTGRSSRTGILSIANSSSNTGTNSAGGSRSLNNTILATAPAFGVLFFGKMSRVFAAFVSFHYLQDRVALPLYLFFVATGAALILLALQRPWNGRRIGQRRGRKLVLAGALLGVTLYLWTAGLRSAGPLRALLIDGAELPLLYLFAIATRRELPERRKTNGALMMLFAYALLIWDASGHVPPLKRIEHTRFGHSVELQLEHLSYKHPHHEGKLVGDAGSELKLHSLGRSLSGKHNPSIPSSGSVRDVFVEGTPLRSEVGVVLILIAAVIMQSTRAFTRRLASELGGAKRHFALSMTCATFWLAPLAIVSSFSNATAAVLSLSVAGGITRMHISLGHALGFAAVGFLWLVVPYYTRAIVSTSLSQKSMLQCGTVLPFILAAGVCVVIGSERSAGGVSWILVTVFILNAVGIWLMMAPGRSKRSLSELPLDCGGNVSVRQTAGE